MLYIVGTSIGNIEDTSLRAAKTLAQADLILAEDTRTFADYYRRIQHLYGCEAKSQQEVTSFHEQNEFERLPFVLKKLHEGKDIALVSESGMPIISDPGNLLVDRAQKDGLGVTVIPGPTAFTTALAYSGYKPGIAFLGFLPKKTSHLSKILSSTSDFVAYESPHRISKTLELLSEINPKAHVTLCRELTKKFEQVIQGTPAELAKKSYKGEITLVVRSS